MARAKKFSRRKFIQAVGVGAAALGGEFAPHRARGEKKGVNYLYADGHIRNLLAIEGTK